MRISAKGIFYDQKGKVILVLSKEINPETGRKYLCAPGGGVEGSESVFEACERELYEETGFMGKCCEIVFGQVFDNPEHGMNYEVFIRGEFNSKQTPNPQPDHEWKILSSFEINKSEVLPIEIKYIITG